MVTGRCLHEVSVQLTEISFNTHYKLLQGAKILLYFDSKIAVFDRLPQGEACDFEIRKCRFITPDCRANNIP